MKPLVIFHVLLAWLSCFSPPAAAARLRETAFFQVHMLRVAPDEAAAFVPMRIPGGAGNVVDVDVLSRHGEWEEVRVRYRFKYNASSDPNVCAMALFDQAFTGFRKRDENN